MDRAAAELERRSRYLRTLIHQQKTSDGKNPKAESLEGEKGKEEGKAPKEESLVVVKQQEEEEKQQRKKGDVGRGGEVDPGEKNQENLRVRAANMPPELQKRAFRCAQQEPLVVVKQQQVEAKQQRKKGDVGRGGEVDPWEKNHGNIRVRAADMPPELQKRAFRCAHQMLAEMPKLDSKRLALTLKKGYDLMDTSICTWAPCQTLVHMTHVRNFILRFKMST